MLFTKISEEIKNAMRAKDATKLLALRNLKASIMNEAVSLKKSEDALTDEEVLAVIKRLVKQRKDSIEQYQKGGRQDLADAEAEELKVLETYLPKMMSEDEIRKIAESKKAEMNVTDKSKAGILVGAVLKQAKGAADGAVVKKIVESLF